MSKKYPDAPANAPACGCCHDSGLVGGDITPPNDCPYRFCLCGAGARLAVREPDAVELANSARADLMKLGTKTLSAQMSIEK